MKGLLGSIRPSGVSTLSGEGAAFWVIYDLLLENLLEKVSSWLTSEMSWGYLPNTGTDQNVEMKQLPALVGKAILCGSKYSFVF